MDTKHPPSLRDLYPNRLVYKYIYARIEIKYTLRESILNETTDTNIKIGS